MKRAIRQTALLAAALILFCALCRVLFYRGYTFSIPLTGLEASAPRSAETMRLDFTGPELFRHGEIEIVPNPIPMSTLSLARFHVSPREAGSTSIELKDADGKVIGSQVVRIGRLMTVYDPDTGGFTGDSSVLIAVTLFWLLEGAIMLWNYRQARGSSFYAYSTVYFAGFFLFALVTGFTMLQITLQHFLEPVSFSMLSAYATLNSASKTFMIWTSPLVAAFALAMMVSNIVLLRYSHPRVQNALGILIGVFLLAGEAVGMYLFSRDFVGSEWEYRVRITMENTYATVFVYFECMLAGSAICGLKAARHVPAADKDFIIILGCWFRPDGTLPPLLRGRADAAISFWRRQKEAGKEALLIPSGGRGFDEPIPEGEAIRRYLLEQGVPSGAVIAEEQANNTYQNMAFSKEIIDRIDPGGRVMFATTNYHVFRSGVWAAQAGLAAEGIGSRTKWWYWPNAFMRECMSLLARRWKQELLFLLALLIFFGTLSLTLG